MKPVEEEKIKIMIVDDHHMVRVGLSTSLEKHTKLEVIALANDGRDAVVKYQELKPDVVLMDLLMPDIDGVEATKQILEIDPNARIIALTSYDDDPLIHSAIEAGVISYLLKDISMKTLVSAIQSTYSGESILAQEATKALMRAAQGEFPGHDLTSAELRVLKLLTEGMSNAEIAQALVISKSTVKKHVSKILEKLDVSNRAEAAVMAVKHRLVDIDTSV
ncbi:MAG: response regulator [Anaerolineae bacterium]